MSAPPVDRRDVTLGNWRTAPFNRWAFSNVRELIATAGIACGPPAPLPVAHRAMPDRLASFLEDTFTDGFMVLKNGAVAFEWYRTAQARKPHVVFSVSKSITALLAGIAVGDGKLDPDLPVGAYLPVRDGTAYGSASVRHVLDMTVSIAFVEDYLNPTKPSSPIAKPRLEPAAKPREHARARRLPADDAARRPPARQAFPLRLANSDLLGLIVESATASASGITPGGFSPAWAQTERLTSPWTATARRARPAASASRSRTWRGSAISSAAGARCLAVRWCRKPGSTTLDRRRQGGLDSTAIWRCSSPAAAIAASGTRRPAGAAR